MTLQALCRGHFRAGVVQEQLQRQQGTATSASRSPGQEQPQRQSNGNDCIEVAPTPSTIHIRDSKNPHGPQLHLRPAAWADFVAYAAAGR